MPSRHCGCTGGGHKKAPHFLRGCAMKRRTGGKSEPPLSKQEGRRSEFQAGQPAPQRHASGYANTRAALGGRQDAGCENASCDGRRCIRRPQECTCLHGLPCCCFHRWTIIKRNRTVNRWPGGPRSWCFAKGHLRGVFRLSLPRDLFLPVLRTGRLCRQAGAICSAQQLRPVHCLPAVCNILLAAGRQLVQKEAPCPARDRGPPGRQVMRVYYFDCSFSGAEALSAFALSASGAAGASGVAATGSSGCAP